jgi:hypothetical protein
MSGCYRLARSRLAATLQPNFQVGFGHGDPARRKPRQSRAITKGDQALKIAARASHPVGDNV